MRIIIFILLFFSLQSQGQIINASPPYRPFAVTPPVTTYLSDTFTDTDGTNLTAHTMNVGSGWTKSANGNNCGTGIDMTINGNKALPSVGTYSIYYADAGVSDCVVSANISVPNANFYVGGLTIRYTDCANYFYPCIERDNGTPYLVIYEKVAGTQYSRATVNVPSATNSTLTITVTLSGNSITVLAGTGETCNYSSSNNSTSTKFGLFGYDAGVSYTPAMKIDNFLVTE